MHARRYEPLPQPCMVLRRRLDCVGYCAPLLLDARWSYYGMGMVCLTICLCVRAGHGGVRMGWDGMGYAGGDGDVCAVCCAAMQLRILMCAGGMGEVLLDESEGEGVSAWCRTTTYVRCAEGR
ncbi:hypothetical protein IQ07DRAFT_592602 [Pyrenochaeta sp. DS3sAY3a]|nr:hypothetical protein IQ07DRAFT_592602 [Pyrenochaeta sp. DS3sAY3a]